MQPFIILKFESQDQAEEVFASSSLDLNGEKIIFKGLRMIPYGAEENLEFYFVGVALADASKNISSYEYDYSCPVASDIVIQG